ncbi:hypothetical protein FBEOM_134, partial [Fusarium beomiforme]
MEVLALVLCDVCRMPIPVCCEFLGLAAPPMLQFVDPLMISSRRVVSRDPAILRPVLRSMSPCLLRDLAHRANQTCEIQFKWNPRTAVG